MYAALLLTISNVFMTFAWYGHLKFKASPLWIAILASWLIALFEYCFQVPANRIGHAQFSVTQLKIMQEAITLTVFVLFAKLFFRGEPIRWNDAVGLVLIFLAVFVVFHEWGPAPAKAPAVAVQPEQMTNPAAITNDQAGMTNQ